MKGTNFSSNFVINAMQHHSFLLNITFLMLNSMSNAICDLHLPSYLYLCGHSIIYAFQFLMQCKMDAFLPAYLSVSL